ncbi:hypothetical protein LCGC14_2855110 [marine sediment metagenome]|uniref:Uncharacterized protein n=1 Tax=marine sediment metagenome TaxID=412755 RepID=A0A0F8YU20_9ZZZZ
MTDTAQIRTLIEGASLQDGRKVVLRMIRFGARRRVYFYAKKNFITDFDSVVVTHRHRDRKDQIIAKAQEHAATAVAATTIEELLAVFDLIAPNL